MQSVSTPDPDRAWQHSETSTEDLAWPAHCRPVLASAHTNSSPAKLVLLVRQTFTPSTRSLVMTPTWRRTTVFSLFTLLAHCVLGDNAINPTFAYGKEPVRGVNLGGWLVLEVRFSPASQCLTVTEVL